MFTSHKLGPDKAIEGAAYSNDLETRAMMLPYLAQHTNVALAAPAIGNMTIDVTHDATGQQWQLVVALSSVVMATSLDEIKAAWEADGELNNLASITEDATSDFDLFFRYANEEYTVAVTPPGAMTATVTEPVSAGGAGIPLGRFVAKAANADGEDQFRALTGSDAMVNVAGFLGRTELTAMRELLNGGPSAVDSCRRGKHYSIAYRGGFYAVTETALDPDDTVYIVTSTAGGAVGRVRNNSTGAISASGFVECESAASAGGLVRVRLNM